MNIFGINPIGHPSEPTETPTAPDFRDEMIGRCLDWVASAECDLSFDHATAQRLAFLRWLLETGRVSAG